MINVDITKEAKAKYLESLMIDWLKTDCDLRWARMQLVRPENQTDEAQHYIKGEVRKLEQLLIAFAERISIQKNLP